jgi:two-component system cell cycle sensor histidine kinase/response regulator CckA
MDRHPYWHKKLEKETKDRTDRSNRLSTELTEAIGRRKEAEEALARDNQEWVRIFDAISDLIMVLDDRHRILRVNKAMADALGMAEQEARGHICWELVHGEKEPPSFCPHAHLLADGKEHSAEVFIPRLGGTYDVTAFPLSSQDSRIVSSVHVARDVTEKKRTEEKIQQQADFMDNVLNSLTHPFYVIDANDYTIQVANRSARLTGVTVGQKCYAATHGRTSPCAGTGHPCPLTEVKKTERPHMVEHIHYDRNGAPRNIEIHSYPIKSSEGGVSQIIEYSLDITERKKAEAALRASEKRYRRLFEDAPLMYVITRNERGVPFISDCNELFLFSLGYKREEVVGQPLADFYSPESRAELLEGGGYVRALAGAFFIGERKLLTREGRLIPTLLYNATELNAIGQVIGTRAMFVDITELKKSERALRESEERFKQVAASAGEWIWEVDAKGMYRYCNSVVERILGYSPDELVGQKHFYDLLAPEVREGLKEATLAAFERREPFRAFVNPNVHKNGSIIILETNGSPVTDEQGALLGYRGTDTDITARKKAEEALRESEERYRDLVENIEDLICTHDLQGNLLFVNKAPSKLLGYDRNDAVGTNLRCYLAPEVKNQFDSYLDAIRRDGHASGLMVVQTKDGQKRIWEYHNVLHKESSKTPIVHGFARDITDRKKAEEERERLQSQLLQAQKMEAIGTLAGGIAHDFNNTLQIILSCTDLLIMHKGKESPDLRNVETIRKIAKDARDLVKGLLTFSRRTHSNKRVVDLSQQLKHVKNILERTIPRMIEIELVVASDLRAVNANPTQINQVLMNLAVNAHHAMRNGGKLTIEARNVTLDEDYCRTHLEARPGDYAMLKISDTGNGMEKEVVEHIFEPFYTTKETGEGTGLGLFIVYGIVKSHDGYVTCSSQPGHGTTFSVYFPAVSGESNADMATTAGEMTAFGTEAILLVDDEQRIRNAVEQILTSRGYKVLTAENGKEALEIYREKRDEIDLVVLDLNMPGISGTEVLEAILKIDPRARVLIASGYSVNESTKRILEGEASGFVRKPFDASEILRAVRRVLDETGIHGSTVGGSGSAFVRRAEREGNLGAAVSLPSKKLRVSEASRVEKSPRSLRILAIDDREPYLRMLEAGLAQFGHTPITASSGIEGLQVLQETQVDVVICDLGMPGLDGWEVSRRVKEICQEREIPKTPFVLLTGQADMEDPDRETGRKMADCGVDAVVGKPVDTPDLLEIIDNMMRTSCGSKE